jgi:hypothetical protein
VFICCPAYSHLGPLLCIKAFYKPTSRVPTVSSRGDSINVNIFLSTFLAQKLIIGLNIWPIDEYHRKNINLNPKNISLCSIIYSKSFQRYPSGFYPFFLCKYIGGMFILLMLVAP